MWILYALSEAEAIPLLKAQREEDEDEEDEDEKKQTKLVPGPPTLSRHVFETGYKSEEQEPEERGTF